MSRSPVLRAQSSQSSLSSSASSLSSCSTASSSSCSSPTPVPTPRSAAMSSSRTASLSQTPLSVSRPTTPIMTPPPSSCSPPSGPGLALAASSPQRPLPRQLLGNDDNAVPHPVTCPPVQRPATPPTDSLRNCSSTSTSISADHPFAGVTFGISHRDDASSRSSYRDQDNKTQPFSSSSSTIHASSYLLSVPRTPTRKISTPHNDRFIPARPTHTSSAARDRTQMLLPLPSSPSNSSAPPEYCDPIHDPAGHFSRLLYAQAFPPLSFPTHSTSSSASRRLPFTLSNSDRTSSSGSAAAAFDAAPSANDAPDPASSSPTRSSLGSSPLARRSNTLATATRRPRPVHSRGSSRDDPVLRSPLAKRIHLDLNPYATRLFPTDEDDNTDPSGGPSSRGRGRPPSPPLPSLAGAGSGAALRTPSTPLSRRRPRLLSLTSTHATQDTGASAVFGSDGTPAVGSLASPGRPHASYMDPDTLAALRAASAATQALRSRAESIPDAPYKVLDAPGIVDDFYLNVLDWSQRNVIAVGLGTAVYLWDAATSQVTLLTDLAPVDTVASVKWNGNGNYLAVGTGRGLVQLWDVTKKVMVREFGAGHHEQRVGVLCWSRDRLLSGSKDHRIFEWDHRAPATPALSLNDHRGEVTAIQWATDNQYLASGGNDNRLLVWDPRRVGLLRGAGSGSSLSPSIGTTSTSSTSGPLYTMTDHTAAVRAVAWSPHNPGVLASGGGTNDKTIRLWNLRSSQPTRAFQMANVGSQVCTLAWSRTTPGELVSTHGFNGNAIVVWDSRNLAPLATLSGHTARVLYMSMSPDGTSIVTGSGDETLRLWKLFPPAASNSARTAAATPDPIVRRYRSPVALFGSTSSSRVYAGHR